MKKMLLVAPFLLLLTACGGPATVEDMVEDQGLLGRVLIECTQLMMQGKDANTEECKNVKLAQEKMAENLSKAYMNQYKKN